MAKRRHHRRHSKTICRSAKGRVKKGWRLGKGGRCIKAKHRR